MATKAKATPVDPMPVKVQAVDPSVIKKTEDEPKPKRVRVRPLHELLEDGDLVARYLEAHGTWEDHHTRTHLGLTTERKLRYCECPICTDARAALNLTD